MAKRVLGKIDMHIEELYDSDTRTRSDVYVSCISGVPFTTADNYAIVENVYGNGKTRQESLKDLKRNHEALEALYQGVNYDDE